MTRFVLSRKGFDSSYGKHPSLILPDGTMLSIPIPEQNSAGERFDTGRRFSELNLPPLPYPVDMDSCCHLDPDIRESIWKKLPENWVPSFGQCNAAQSHLRNHDIGAGDVFLFFGLFQKVDDGGRLVGRCFHAIWGYMQVESVLHLDDPEDARTASERLPWHPHTTGTVRSLEPYEKHNTLYVGSRRGKLRIDGRECGYPSYGAFRFTGDSEKFLRLTIRESQQTTRWDYEALPWVDRIGRRSNMTYHPDMFQTEYFQSASRGEEFVIAREKSSTAESRLLEILNVAV